MHLALGAIWMMTQNRTLPRKALVVGGAGTTGVLIVEALLERGYEVTILHRGVHPAPVPEEVRRIYADPHWREPLDEALEGHFFDLTIATYGRLRYVAEALVGRTERLISVGGALPVYAGWMNITYTSSPSTRTFWIGVASVSAFQRASVM